VAELMSPDEAVFHAHSRRRPLPQRGGFRPVAARLGRLAACRLRRARLRWHRVRPPLRMHRLPSHAADGQLWDIDLNGPLACQQVAGRARAHFRSPSIPAGRTGHASIFPAIASRSKANAKTGTSNTRALYGMRRSASSTTCAWSRPSQFKGTIWRSPCCMNRLLRLGRALWTDITDETSTAAQKASTSPALSSSDGAAEPSARSRK